MRTRCSWCARTAICCGLDRRIADGRGEAIRRPAHGADQGADVADAWAGAGPLQPHLVRASENRVTLIYVIGGPTRCGKTELALRLLHAHSLPIFSTDLFGAFMADIDAGGPQPTAPWSDEEYFVRAANVESSRARMRLHLPNLLWGVRGVYGSAVFEGVEFLPDQIPQLAEGGEVRAVFLVRHRVELAALIARSDRHDWLRHFGAPVQKAIMAEIERHSAQIVDQAERQRIAVVDVSQDFEAAMTAAGAALGLPLETGH